MAPGQAADVDWPGGTSSNRREGGQVAAAPYRTKGVGVEPPGWMLREGVEDGTCPVGGGAGCVTGVRNLFPSQGENSQGVWPFPKKGTEARV